MPFVTFENVQHLIPEEISQEILEKKSFKDYESDAANEIHELTGLSIPDDAKNTPEWVVWPAAAIITKLAAVLWPAMGDTLKSQIESNYKRAVERLRGRVQRGVATDISYSGSGSLTKMNKF